MTLTRRFTQKKWGKGPPPKIKSPPKIISKNYFFSNSISSTQIVIPCWTAGGVRALWVSEHPLWRTRYFYYFHSLLILPRVACAKSDPLLSGSGVLLLCLLFATNSDTFDTASGEARRFYNCIRLCVQGN